MQLLLRTEFIMAEMQPPALTKCCASVQNQRPAAAGLVTESMALQNGCRESCPTLQDPTESGGHRRAFCWCLTLFPLRRIGIRGYICWQKFSSVSPLPSGSLPTAVCGAFWWQSSKAEPCSPFLAVRFLLDIGAGAWVLFPLSLVLADFVILDALAFTR